MVCSAFKLFLLGNGSPLVLFIYFLNFFFLSKLSCGGVRDFDVRRKTSLLNISKRNRFDMFICIAKL